MLRHTYTCTHSCNPPSENPGYGPVYHMLQRSLNHCITWFCNQLILFRRCIFRSTVAKVTKPLYHIVNDTLAWNWKEIIHNLRSCIRLWRGSQDRSLPVAYGSGNAEFISWQTCWLKMLSHDVYKSPLVQDVRMGRGYQSDHWLDEQPSVILTLIAHSC